MGWEQRWNRARRKPWPKHVSTYYEQITRLIGMLYEATDLMLQNEIDPEFCEDLEALCRRLKNQVKELWTIKGSERWGYYVTGALTAIEFNCGEAIIEFKGAARGANNLQGRITRAFNLIDEMREAIEEVNPPPKENGIVALEVQGCMSTNQWLELMQLRRHQADGNG